MTIPNGVTSIGDGVFYNCYDLISVTVGNGVMSIGGHVFFNCYDLISVTFANPNGWAEKYGEEISAETLSDPATAAERLKNDYVTFGIYREQN